MSAAAQQVAPNPRRTYFTADADRNTRHFMLEKAAQYCTAPALIIVPRDAMREWSELIEHYTPQLVNSVVLTSPGNLKLCQDESYGVILHEVVDFGFAQYPQLSRLIDKAPVYIARVERPDKNLGNAHHLPGERKAPPSTYLRFVNNHGLVSEGHLSALPQI